MSLLVMVVQVFGGLGLFLMGIDTLSAGMEEVAGTKVQEWLEKAVNHPLKAATFGFAAVAILQSSGLLMVTMIGLINANLLTLNQAIGVMMGSEIGTTLTAQLVAFDIGSSFWVLFIVGYFLTAFGEERSWQPIGKALLGLGIVFLALETMKAGAAPLTKMPVVQSVFVAMGENPLLGILVSLVFTAAVQSSSASTSLLIALGATNAISLPGAIGVILGANLGSCITGFIAAVRSSTAAKRASYAQILINITGVVLMFPFIAAYSRFIATTSSSLPRQIANAHTFFNVFSSVAFFPFIGWIEKAAVRLVPSRGAREERITRFLDDHLLNVPSIALEQAQNELVRTAEMVGDMLEWSRAALIDLDQDAIQKVIDCENNKIDLLCAAIDRFLNRVLRGHVDEGERRRVFQLKYLVSDVERVGDMAENLAQAGQERIKEQIVFSPAGNQDLTSYLDLTTRVWRRAVQSFATGDVALAREVEQGEDEINQMHTQVRNGHLRRLEQGICQYKADILFVETLRNLERIGDHADNLALGVLQANSSDLSEMLRWARSAVVSRD